MTDEKPAAEERWSGVKSVPSEAEGALVVGFLESQGIPARLVDRSFSETPTSSEDLTEIEVAVPTDRVAEAEGILSRRDVAFEGQAEGEATLLTDEGPAEIDPSAEPGT